MTSKKPLHERIYPLGVESPDASCELVAFCRPFIPELRNGVVVAGVRSVVLCAGRDVPYEHETALELAENVGADVTELYGRAKTIAQQVTREIVRASCVTCPTFIRTENASLPQ